MARRNVILGLVAAALTLALIPRMIAGLRAKGFYEGAPSVTLPLAPSLVGFEARDENLRGSAE
jgi:hypothetical protein